MNELTRAGAGDGGAPARALDIGAARMTSIYRFECFDKHGALKWVEEVHNLVTNQGLNDLLDKYFKGSGYTAAWFAGLKGAGSAAAGDTLASHAGWSELTDYTGDRKALVLGSVTSQSVSNTGSPAEFVLTDDMTIAGGFVTTAETGSSGVLYGAADFASPRALQTDDVLRLTVTLSAADAT